MKMNPLFAYIEGESASVLKKLTNLQMVTDEFKSSLLDIDTNEYFKIVRLIQIT